MSLDPDIPNAESPVSSLGGRGKTRPEQKPEPRLVWQTVALLAYFAWLIYSTRRPPSRHPGPFRSSTQIVHLAFQWSLWFLACWGIRGSGLRYKEVVGSFPASKAAFWSACGDAVYIWGGYRIVSALLAWLSPFTLRHTSPPITAWQFFLTLLGALSAGYTEEVINRGLLMSQFHILTRNRLVAVLLQAFVFAAAHGGNQSLSEFFEHFVVALLFAYFAIRRKSLWPSIMGHAWIDVLWYLRRFLRG